MANINLKEDKDGDLLEIEYFCSDYCADQSPNYSGWYGCIEIYTPEICQTCETPLKYYQQA